MLSPTEIRPWVQLALVVLGVMACYRLQGGAQITLADQSVMNIGERTDVEIQEFRFNPGSRAR